MNDQIIFNKTGLKIAIWFLILVSFIIGNIFGYTLRSVTTDKNAIYTNQLEISGQNCTDVYPFSYDSDFPDKFYPKYFKMDDFYKQYSRLVICDANELIIQRSIK